MSTTTQTVLRRGTDTPMKFDCGWGGDGLLFLSQDQSKLVDLYGGHKQPTLVLYAEQLPALMAAIKAAAAEGVQEIAGEIRHHQAVLAELRALADEPLPLVTPEKPAKKKGATRHE